MGYYRKKPVIIQALKFEKGVSPEMIIQEFGINPVIFEGSKFYIDTLEGRMELQLGEWIIKGIKGEFYPCKSDIFDQTYNEVGG